MEPGKHLFVSHSRENSSAAFRLCEELRTRDIQTWLDLRDLPPGGDWNQIVTEAIRTAAGFVFILGPSGGPDRYQSFEWQHVVDNEFYLDAEKPLLPVVIGQPELPGFLRARQSVALNDTPAAFAEAADAIAKALSNPAVTIDQSKLEVGRKVRMKALESLREYSEALGKEQLKRAGTHIEE